MADNNDDIVLNIEIDFAKAVEEIAKLKQAQKYETGTINFSLSLQRNKKMTAKKFNSLENVYKLIINEM